MNQDKTIQFKVRISIHHKIMLYVGLLVLATVGITTYVAAKIEAEVLIDELIHYSKHRAEHVISSTTRAFSSLNWVGVEKMLQEVTECERKELLYAKVIKPNGEVYLADQKKYYGDTIDPALLYDEETVLDNYHFPHTDEYGMLLIHPFKIGDDLWRVILGVSVKSIQQATKELIARNLVYGGLITLLGLIGAFFLSRSISGPIIAIANAAKVVSQGKSVSGFIIKSRDEVGFLNHYLGIMVDNLKDVEQQLREANQNLEEKIEERTKELKETNLDLRNTQTQLIQTEKMSAIGQLASGIAHEINTPTQYVSDNAHFLQESFDDITGLLDKYNCFSKASKTTNVPEKMVMSIEKFREEIDIEYLLDEIPKSIKQTLEGIDQVTMIVQAMKDFSRPGVENRIAVDINNAIANTIAISRNEWKYIVDMKTQFDSDLPMVTCLPGEFNQVILNLIVNAADAIGGVAGDKTENKGTITLVTLRDGDYVEVRISDTGSGIPAEIRSKIFDPFFTTKEVGSGIGYGLSVCHDVIVNKHHGTITFETEIDKGTTFIIRMPINTSEK